MLIRERRRGGTAEIDFPLRVGARIPRYIELYDMPDELVEYVPEYEGYRYTILEDEIVLIDPESREIVAVIPE